MKLDKGGLELILDTEKKYNAINYIRDAILNIFNPIHFSNVDLLRITCSLDEEHYELFVDILDTVRVHGVSDINKIAIQFLEKNDT